MTLKRCFVATHSVTLVHFEHRQPGLSGADAYTVAPLCDGLLFNIGLIMEVPLVGTREVISAR